MIYPVNNEDDDDDEKNNHDNNNEHFHFISSLTSKHEIIQWGK